MKNSIPVRASGLARSLAMAAIIAAEYGDPEIAARLAGAAHKLAREKAVMLAPVEVLKLRDPADTVVELLGAERAAELMQVGEDTDVNDLVAWIESSTGPGTPRTSAAAAKA